MKGKRKSDGGRVGQTDTPRAGGGSESCRGVSPRLCEARPRGGHGESCCRGGKRPVPSSPPRGNPDLTFRSRQSHRAPGTRAGGQAAPTPFPGEGAAGRDPQPSSPLSPPPPCCLPCPCLGAGRRHPAAPAALPAPRQQRRGGTWRGHKFPEQTVPASPGNGIRCFPAQPWPPPPPPPINPKQTQHRRGDQHPPHLAGGNRGTAAHGGPSGNSIAAGSTWGPDLRLAGVRFLLCPVSRPFPPAGASPGSSDRPFGYRPPIASVPSHPAWRGPAQRHLGGLKSRQLPAPGIFPSPGNEGSPCPCPLLWTCRCSVPQFPWLRVAWENSAYPIQEHLEMKGTILPRFFPSGGSGPTQLLSWPPALPGGSESPPTPSEWGYVTVHPKAPRWGGPCLAPLSRWPPYSPLWAAAHVARNLGLEWD